MVMTSDDYISYLGVCYFWDVVKKVALESMSTVGH